MEAFKWGFFTTLTETRAWVQANKRDGVTCPCCRQIAREYRRKIHSGMAAALIEFYRIGTWHNGDHLFTSTKALLVSSEMGIANSGRADFAKMAHWELIEEKKHNNDDVDRRTSGYWRVTKKGADFILGKIRVPEHAIIYDSRLVRLEGRPVSIRECLGSKFNYRELIGEGFESQATNTKGTGQTEIGFT